MVARYLQDDKHSAQAGLAGDELLLHNGELCLRLYTYASTAAICGRFQNIEEHIDLSRCRELGITVSRRLTGGGAIIMGEDQLGIALVAPGDHELGTCPPREALMKCAKGISMGLDRLGIKAVFKGKNDIECNGKKIAGTGLARNEEGTTLFHSSLLLSLDVGLMLEALRTPSRGKEYLAGDDVESKITTVSKELGQPVDLEKVRSAVKEGYSEAFGWSFAEKGFNQDEHQAINLLSLEKYSSPEWIYDTDEDYDDKHFACFA